MPGSPGTSARPSGCIFFAAWERGDFRSAEWANPEIEFGFSGEGPAPGTVTGMEAMGRDLRDRLSALADVRFEAEEYRELDDDRVLVLSLLAGRGKTSRLDVGAKSAALFHVRRGKVTRLVIWVDRERALADLGLAPNADFPAG